MPEQPKLLLCVEDDNDDSLWIEEATAEIDPSIIFVNKRNGRDALMFLERQKQQHFLPCLILLDINMPLMDGKQTLLEIKKDPELRNIPVIMFTTSNNKKDQWFCEQQGVDMVTKPERSAELKRTIHFLVFSRCA